MNQLSGYPNWFVAQVETAMIVFFGIVAFRVSGTWVIVTLVISIGFVFWSAYLATLLVIEEIRNQRR